MLFKIDVGKLALLESSCNSVDNFQVFPQPARLFLPVTGPLRCIAINLRFDIISFHCDLIKTSVLL